MYQEEEKQDSLNSPIETENLRHSSISEQLFNLKTDILEVQDKFHQSNELLRLKEDENRKLREKLLSLEMAVQNLFDNTRAGSTGCCSQQCTLF